MEAKLRTWSMRADLKETSSEGAFVSTFFEELWGYNLSGRNDGNAHFNLSPQHPIPKAGQGGGTGSADLAIGWFESEVIAPTPQILCEFKDIKSGLDAPQNRRGNNRSPVKQALDYLSHARRGMFGNEAILPTWAIVTDMNEFRLYWYDRAPQQYISFIIQPSDLFHGEGLLADSETARFNRFLFYKLFQRDNLLTEGGKSKLEQLIARQWVQQRELENTFYTDYRKFRETLYSGLIKANPEFSGTKGRLVRLSQKILDRCIFVFFCEDMGNALGFPPQLLRDFLIHESRDQYFDQNDDNIWHRLCKLFQAMNDGTAFGTHKINQFNGGLFAKDDELDNLTIPNFIFCLPGQGENEASLYAHKKTLLYMSAAYNYASEGMQAAQGSELRLGDAAKNDPSKSLGLYTLGRIFEQSITELEILEAKADGLLSLNEEGKRKRDGVFYTPEWVVERIVYHTLNPRLDELRNGSGWPTDDDALPSQQAIDAYREQLKGIKIVDPACGSGAFLITVLRYLITEWASLRQIELAAAENRVAKAVSRQKGITKARKDLGQVRQTRDEATLIQDILRTNIYGVDINPASVEIARLALWLHTARGDKPLSSLNDTVRDGNSLIGPDFYHGRMDLDSFDANKRERVNAFDWHEAFPEVFESGGFDAVVGNPPYVKLQNFRKVHADVAAFLVKNGDGSVSYESTQTGNFDLYLPFIEQGIRLLNDNGRMGYICPSLWVMNEYGAGLRRQLAQTRQLSGWVDFRAHQIFDEATTYTALQFFTKQPNDAIQVALAPEGTLPEDPWASDTALLPYDEVGFGDRWLLLTGAERKLIDRLYERYNRLDDPAHTANIYQGLITSMDTVYHLKRLGPDRYLCSPKTPKGQPKIPAYEVGIEDDIMKPLVSGAEAKRYTVPATETYLLFPYIQGEKRMGLISADDMAQNFPKAWTYLKTYEDALRGRESGKFDDEDWHRFGRNQSLDKQEISKLVVPRIVVNVRCSVDEIGTAYLDNVDVGGVAVADGENLYFIAGILNAPVTGFVFRATAKPFRGEYRSANKQFIAPLPIPPATPVQKENIAKQAKALQVAHTARRDVLVRLQKRLGSIKPKNRPVTWLFPDLPAKSDLEVNAPKEYDTRAVNKWGKDRLDEECQTRYGEITERLHAMAVLTAKFDDGELQFLIDGIVVLKGIWLADEEGTFIASQWSVLAATFPVTDKTTGKKLCDALRKVLETENAAMIDQVKALQEELASLDDAISKQEAKLDVDIYALYNMDAEDIALIAKASI